MIWVTYFIWKCDKNAPTDEIRYLILMTEAGSLWL